MDEEPSRTTPRDAEREPVGASGRDPRRTLAAIGFVLLGGWFAWTSATLDATVALRVVLVLLGLGVLGYGLAQAVRPRR